MSEETHSFGLLLGNFLDKASMAMDDLATASEILVHKLETKYPELRHPAEIYRNNMAGIDSVNKVENKKSTNSPKKQNNQTSDKKVEEKTENSKLQNSKEASIQKSDGKKNQTKKYLEMLAQASYDESEEEEDGQGDESYSDV